MSANTLSKPSDSESATGPPIIATPRPGRVVIPDKAMEGTEHDDDDASSVESKGESNKDGESGEDHSEDELSAESSDNLGLNDHEVRLALAAEVQ